MKDKPLGEGTLDYLSGSGSAYKLEKDDETEYDPSEGVPTGDLLRYDKKDISAWLNKSTGEVVYTEPSDTENYYSITLKELTPELYSFQFKENITNLSYGSAPYDVIENIAVEIPTLTPENEPYQFTYSYNTQDLQTAQSPENATGLITGVFKGFNNVPVSNKGNNNSSSPIIIKADFIGNTNETSGHDGKGGAVRSIDRAYIESVEGNFIGNHATQEGGAIWNWGNSSSAYIVTGSISGVFINNYVSNEDANPHRGGALFNADYSTIEEIRGAFIGNWVYGRSSSTASSTNVGGAIYNAQGGKIDAIYADFIGNYVSGKGHGGAIYNGGGGANGNTEPASIIKRIEGDFIANHVTMPSNLSEYETYGGAIANQAFYSGGYQGGAVIEHIKSDFIRNYTHNHDGTAGGGAIYNNRQAQIYTIEGNFISNSVTSGATGLGIENDFHLASGGAIMNFFALDKNYDITNPDNCSTIWTINSNFYHNYAEATSLSIAQGGAISNHTGGSYIGTIVGDFIGNYAKAVNNYARGGAIFTDDNSVIQTISGNFYNNYVISENERANGGAIRNGGAMDTILNAVFKDNYAESHFTPSNDKYMSRFIAKPENRTLWYNGSDHNNVGIYYQIGAYGGAIHNEAELTIVADKTEGSGIVFFSGNKTIQGDKTERNEAIYGRDGSEITLKAINNGAIFFDDRIRGEQLFALVGTKDTVLAVLSNTSTRDIATHQDELKATFGNYERVEQVGSGFKLKLTGDNTDSSVVFSAPVSYADVEMEKISLVLHVDSESDVTEDLKSSYLDKPLLDKYGDDYRVSYILRASSLDAQSGLVGLQDGLTTEYFIGTLNTNGAKSLDGFTEIPENYTADNVLFNIDVNLNKGVSDIFTVFGVKDHRDDANWKTVNWGSDRRSVSTGYLSISPTFLLEGNSYTYENQELREKMFTVQVINFVVMEGQQGTVVEDDDYYKKRFREPNTDIIQLTEIPAYAEWARSYMNSSDVLSKGIWLSTTKTYHDSFTIIGWRDPLAAWAELLPDDEHGGWEASQDGEKVYELLANAYVTLTRNTVDKKTATDNDPATAKEVAAVQGTDHWTIKGHSGSVLNLDGHNLLTVVTQEQKARMQYFALMNVQKQQILNEGELTLDSMAMMSELTLLNEKKLTLTGEMIVNHTITSADTNREMVIENSSDVFEKTSISIENTIEKQNIVHRGEGTRDADNFTTETTLRVTQAPQMDTRAMPRAADEDLSLTEAFKRFNNNSLDMQGGRFSLLGTMPTDALLSLRTLAMNGGTLWVERSLVDLAKKQMGGIRANNATGNSGEIYLGGMAITADSHESVTHVQFVNEEVGQLVQDDVRGSKISGPVYEYLVTYNDSERVDAAGEAGREGFYTFSRTGSVNPAIQSGAINEQTQLAMSTLIADYAFEHAELYSDSAYQNHLYEQAFTSVSPMKGKDYASGFGPSSGGAKDTAARSALWARPFASYENIPLGHGPKVSMHLYGALVGVDSDLTRHSNDWLSVFTGYLGYTGSQQKWEGTNRSRTNGGLIGATETFYKGSFYTALTVSAGITSGNTTTAFGRESFDIVNAGVASRTGYNIPLGQNRQYVLQPSVQLSYTYIGMDDYTNGAGVRVDSDPLHVFQVHPFVKLIRHTSTDWKPYAVGGVVWNLGSGTKFRADGDKLPELSIRPYAEYGAGVQKVWRDRYTFYGQTTGRSGGRQGIEFSAGVRRNW